MREHQHLGAFVGKLQHGRHRRADARVVGDRAVLHRQVEIDANQRDLAGHVAKVVQGTKRAHCSGPHFIGIGNLAADRAGVPTGPRTDHAARSSVKTPRLRQMSLAMAPAVSIMRLEKPHSLSYHDRTRTSLPSITAVSRLSIVELWAL